VRMHDRWPHAVRALVTTALAAMLALGPASAYADESIGGLPVDGSSELSEAAPRVQMPSGILRTMDGRTLWERDADTERAMASTTKIMTALVVLDHAEPSERVTVSASAAGVGEAEVDLVAGQTLTVGELLEAMLVRSANDAAFALAEHVAGSVDGFVGLMNKKASELGLVHTSFANPHGLDAPNHYTTAADLATLGTIAMADPRFAEVVGKSDVMVPGAGGMKRYESSNKLLGSYEGATGIKTGWTGKAGYCLVASALRDDVGFVAVVLGTDSEDARFDDARDLLDWGFQHYSMVPVATAETTAALVPVADYLDRTVTAKVGDTAVVPVFDLDGDITSRVDMVPEVGAPVAAGQRLGTLSVVQGQRLLAQVPIVAASAVPEPDTWEGVTIWFTRAWRSVFGGSMQATAVPLM